MRIRLGVPSDANRDEKKAILDAALESVTRANEASLLRGLPSFADALHAGKVRWRPEPPGDEHFDLGKTVLRRGWGDCDDLAPWHAASLRTSGEDPEATAFVRPSGPNRWHAVVQRSNGTIEDPSRAAGMGSVGGDDYGGPFWPAMFADRLAMAASPLAPGYGWAGRVDIPSTTAPGVYSTLARAPYPAGAIVGACHGTLEVCGDDMYWDDYLKVAGLADLISGIPPDEVEDCLESHGGVGFLPMLAPLAASVAAPLAQKALGMFGMGGGGGAPAAAPAPSGGGGGGGGYPSGTTMHMPGGPIIVRF
jgi:hypothetical protein